LEQNKYVPSIELAFRVAKAFGVPLEEVFNMKSNYEEVENMQAIYTGISIAAFIAILVLLVFKRRKIHRISYPHHTWYEYGSARHYLWRQRWISYSLIGVGVLLSVIDAKYVKRHGETSLITG